MVGQRVAVTIPRSRSNRPCAGRPITGKATFRTRTPPALAALAAGARGRAVLASLGLGTGHHPQDSPRVPANHQAAPTERFPPGTGSLSDRQITAQPVRPSILHCKPALHLLLSFEHDGRSDRYDRLPKRAAALTASGGLVERLVSGEPRGEILPLTRRRAAGSVDTAKLSLARARGSAACRDRRVPGRDRP